MAKELFLLEEAASDLGSSLLTEAALAVGVNLSVHEVSMNIN